MKTALKPYFGKRDFKVTSEPQGGAASQAAALVRDPEARREPPPLRLSPRARRHAEELGRAEGAEPRSGRQAHGRARRGPSDRLRRLRGRDPERPVRRRHGDRLGQRHLGAGRRCRRPATAPASSSSSCTARSSHGGWTLVRMHGRGDERQEPWLLIKERDEAARPASEYSVVEAEPGSVLSDRTIPDRAGEARRKCEGGEDGGAAEDATSHDSSEGGEGRQTPATKRSGAAGRSTRRRRQPHRRAGAKAGRLARRSRRSSPRWSPRRRPTTAGSTRSSSTAIGCSPASTATTCASSRATATTGRRACRASSTRCARSASARAGSTARSWSPARSGAPDFNALQNAFDSSRTESIQYYVFDLPFHDGHDLRARAAGRAARRAARRCSTRAPAQAARPLQPGLRHERRRSCCRTPAACASRA